MCYMREFEVILLVGLTELKAQIGWIDSVTVSPSGTLSSSTPFLIFAMREFRERRKGLIYPFQDPPYLRLNLPSRSDAVVVYDDPSQWTT